LRRGLPWSNTPQAWAERLAAAALLAAAAALAWWGAGLGLPQQFGLWGLLLLALAVLLRRGWVKLVGPVLFYELVRTGRRGRYLPVRCLYAFLLLSVLLFDYAAWFLFYSHQPFHDIFYGASLSAGDMANFALSFFVVFTCLQLTAVFLLTPAYAAGVLAEEKERQTLEALFATDLRNHEIVFGIYLARLANLALVVLAGLPVLSLVQFLGGV